MRLLLIEDDAALRLGLARQLEGDGYRVDQAADGEDGLFQAREYPVDLAIVDLGLPKLNGITVVQRLRAEGRTLPILILTARGGWQDKVQGLEAGADDYLAKPFEYPELAARVKALLRRSMKATSDVLTLGPLSIDFSAQSARLDGEPLDLTTFEYRMLELLVRERARVVSKQELSDYLYPHDEDRDSNVIEVLIGRLRRKLDPKGTRAPIETLPGAVIASRWHEGGKEPVDAVDEVRLLLDPRAPDPRRDGRSSRLHRLRRRGAPARTHRQRSGRAFRAAAGHDLPAARGRRTRCERHARDAA